MEYAYFCHFDLICAWIWFNKSILHNFEFSKIPKLAKFSNLQVLFHLARLLDKPEYYEDEGILRRENYLHNSAMLLNRKPANQPWLTFHVKRLRNCWSSKLKVRKNYDMYLRFSWEEHRKIGWLLAGAINLKVWWPLQFLRTFSFKDV